MLVPTSRYMFPESRYLREHEDYLRLESSSCPLSQLAFLLSCERSFQSRTGGKMRNGVWEPRHKGVRQKGGIEGLGARLKILAKRQKV